MIAIPSLLVTLTLSLLVTRVAAMALMLTGVSREVARFQARSAFSGVGFTTNESDDIVDHPVRRQIIMTLMLLGNIGIATVVATIMISFIDTQHNERWLLNMSILSAGLSLLWIASKSRWVERHLNKAISWALRRFTHLEVRDYMAILHLRKGYAVSELRVEPSDWLVGKTLMESRLSKEGVLVLGIQSAIAGEYLGAPTAQTTVQAEDTLVLYGPIDRLAELDQRRAGHRGDAAHREAVAEHKELLEEQEESVGQSAVES